MTQPISQAIALEQYLWDVPDPRRAQGKRISKSQLFAIIVLSNLCGHLGGRPIARFAKNYKETFIKELNLKHKKVPSHVTITDFINRVDQQAMINAFNNWASNFVDLQKGDFVSGDGKVLGSTVIHPSTKKQDFQAIVSLFCQHSGLVYAIEKHRQQKENEIDVVRFLIGKLKDMGLNIFLDALHCQKKQLNI